MNARAQKSGLVRLPRHTFVAADIVAFRVTEGVVYGEGNQVYDKLTLVWVRTHRGQYNFGEPGDHSEALAAAMEAANPTPLVELRRGVKGPSAEDLAHFQYVLDNSDTEADEDDPFYRLAKWALALPREGA